MPARERGDDDRVDRDQDRERDRDRERRRRSRSRDRVAERTDRGAERTDRGAERTDRGAERTDRGAERIDRGAERIDRGAERSDRGGERSERRSRRTRSRSRSPSHKRKPTLSGANVSTTGPSGKHEEPPMSQLTEEERQMKELLGFGAFHSTKGKKVDGNNVGAVHVIMKRKYRQYMNRKGGFNRPLDFVA